MTSQASSGIGPTVARNIRDGRLAAALTQRQVAEKIGVDAMLVSKWERGRHRPNDENLAALAQMLGREIVWFYTDHSRTSNGNGRKAS